MYRPSTICRRRDVLINNMFISTFSVCIIRCVFFSVALRESKVHLLGCGVPYRLTNLLTIDEVANNWSPFRHLSMWCKIHRPTRDTTLHPYGFSYYSSVCKEFENICRKQLIFTIPCFLPGNCDLNVFWCSHVAPTYAYDGT
jgi:hypothetical protein